MDCISANELPEFELMAYLEGEARPDVVGHLVSCPHCQNRLEALAGEQALLKARLFRSQCPAPITLGEYQLDKLPQAERLAIASHIHDCPHCRAEIRQLESYLRDLALTSEAPEASPVDHLRVLVARLVGGGEAGPARPPVIAPSWAEVRGSEIGPRMYLADDVQVTVEVQEDSHRPAARMLLGLMIGVSPLEMEAQLWQEDRLIKSVAVESAGNFVLTGVEPGRYELHLRGGDLMIKIQEFDVS